MNEEQAQKGGNPLYIIVGVIVVALLLVWLLTSGTSEESSVAVDDSSAVAPVTTEVLTETTEDVPPVPVGTPDEVITDEGTPTQVAGSYEVYAPEKLARAEEGDVVIFFHATWCPSCRSADKNLSSEEIPEGLTILKADYDENTELRQKYGLTSQHSFVQVDAEGTMIKKWLGSSNAAQVATQTQ